MTDNEAARGDDCDDLAQHDQLRCIWIGEDEARVNDEVSSQIGRSRDTNCPSSAPSPADNLPDFYARNPTLPAYLLMPPGYGGAVGEVTP